MNRPGEALGDSGRFWEGRGENDVLNPAPSASEDHHLATELLRDSMLSPIASLLSRVNGLLRGTRLQKP